MMSDEKWTALQQAEDMAYFKADLCCYSPESYTIEEMKAISDGMFASTAEVEEAMHRDFAELPPHAQAKMLDLLREADPEHFSWWMETLIETASNMPPKRAAPSALI